MITYEVDKFAEQAALTADQFYENLDCNKPRKPHEPLFLSNLPEETAEIYTKPGVPFLNDVLKTLTTVCKYMATEIFYHPSIRKWI